MRKILILFAITLLGKDGFTQSPSIVKGSSIEYKTKENILYRTPKTNGFTPYMEERCRLDIYYPENSKNFATVVWFHGGGLRNGNKFFPEQLKEQGIAIIAVNYRLFPKVKAPAYIDDAAASVAWVFNNIESYGGDPNKIFVAGMSAGGYLVSMIGLDKSWLAGYGIEANKIAGLIPVSGHTITHFTVREERGIEGTQPVIDALAPLFHVRKDAPPLILITGDREIEMLGRYEENAYLMRMMKIVGHEETYLYEIQGHGHGPVSGPSFHILLHHLNEIIEKNNTK
ncbi:MAG: alpha/beta hydrolase [Cyclobacteriaceae bacterium]|nr:alpha/beta hydrolase [Cyclobacteriaceae bacterium]